MSSVVRLWLGEVGRNSFERDLCREERQRRWAAGPTSERAARLNDADSDFLEMARGAWSAFERRPGRRQKLGPSPLALLLHVHSHGGVVVIALETAI